MADKIIRLAGEPVTDFRAIDLGDGTYALAVGNAPTAGFTDAGPGRMTSVRLTLNATVGTVTQLAIPDTAVGFRIYPTSNDVRFAVSEDPVAIGAPAAAAAGTRSNLASAGNLTVGAIAKADQWEPRILAAGTSRTIRFISTTASVSVEVEIW